MTRSAFTIVEVLISLTVIGVLMSLIVPAVQSVRGSARLVDCRNRQKQIGLAIHAVQESKQHFSCDWHVLYHYGMGVPGYDPLIAPVGSVGSPLLQCPADPHSMTGSDRSYEMSNGTQYGTGNGYLAYSHTPGVQAFRRISDFTDGLSQTVAFSERTLVIEADQLNPQDDPKKYPAWIPIPMNTPGTEQQFIELCRSPGNSPIPLSLPLLYADGYTHMFTPNTRGCWNNAPVNDPSLKAYMPANSFHTGGVNALFVDGHVSFVSDSVDAKVWQALGTINGNESISSPF